MFKRSEWLKKYGLIVKFVLIVLFFVCLGGLNIINSCREVNADSSTYSHNAKLEDWTRPPAYEGAEFEQWKARKEAAKKEISELIETAESKGKNYSLVDYFSDYNKLMDLEDKYNFLLTSIGYYTDYPLPKFVVLRDRVGISSKVNENIAPAQQAFIESVQSRISMRRGEAPASKKCSTFDWGIFITILRWQGPKYLLLMLFWFLIYIIRFKEHTWAKMKVQRFHHEKHFYFETEEISPGEFSLRNEIILCPWRFFSRIILWPFFCLKYPLYETTAEMVRYNRLKAEYLRYQSVGYQLSDHEELILRAKARAPIKDFAKTIKGIKEFQITPLIVRKSLATAYISLALGVLFQPAIVLASSYSAKINAHFYGQFQIVEIGHETQFFDNHGSDPPHESTSSWVIPVGKFEHEELLFVWRLVIYYLLIKPEEMIKEIFHVPLTRLFLGAAKVYKPLTV